MSTILPLTIFSRHRVKIYNLIIMKKKIYVIFLLMIGLLVAGSSAIGQGQTDKVTGTISFDDGWRFIKGNPAGAENPAFDDSGWRKLDVPHDWSIEDLPGQNGVDIIGPFDRSSVDKMSSGYLIGGTGWYRKTFTTDMTERNKFVNLQFDGVYMNSDVWINGKHLGFHPYGYTPFNYDITPFLNPGGKPNVVAVRVRNEGLNSRWYSGSGITRHVWLTGTNQVHIDVSGGVYITTPSVSENSADVTITTYLKNTGAADKQIVLKTQLYDPSGKMVGTASTNSLVKHGETDEVIQLISLQRPALWSTDLPNLYIAKVSVVENEKVIDFKQSQFGVRSIKIDAKTGLTINGKPVEMMGGCYHHDNGPLGAASLDRAEERKIEVLKKAGFNAIRTSHNPPSPALLDACDKLGMLVLNEGFDMWETAKKEQDYHLYFREWWQRDVESWIKRDRNHPSVIIWSIGNEIRETFDTAGLRIAKNLTHEIRRFDKTRFVTECFNDFAWMRGQKSKWDEIPEHMALFDLIGYNYAYKRYEEDHVKYPDRVMVGSETNPPLSLENYELVKKLPYVIGYFTWTATDNIGEAGVGMPQLKDITPESKPAGNPPERGQAAEQVVQAANAPAGVPGAAPGTPPAGGGFFRRDPWPVYTNYQGDIDIIGNRKVPSYYQWVVWGKSKVEMFVHRPIPEGKKEAISNWGFPDELKSWNWAGQEGKKLMVHVYTRSQQVKLELNGEIVGEQNVEQGKTITATFDVQYAQGRLVAHCYDNGKETSNQILETSGKPASIRLVADRNTIRADRNDLSYVRAEILDSKGNIVPDADDIVVNFIVTGKGKVAGVGSGNPGDMSSFQQPKKKAYQGSCLAIVRPETTPGNIYIKATADGLKEASVTISSR
jgi:beta-galactosidase